MNREEILKRLGELPWAREDYWVLGGGAMALYGIRAETGDLDLGCTTALAERLEREGCLYRVLPDGSRWLRPGEDLELFEGWMAESVVSLDGVPVVSIPGLIAMKRELGREKDLRDLERIRVWQEEKEQKGSDLRENL